MFENWSLIKIISACIPLFAVVISYLLGINTKAKQRKIDALRERYLQLYVPFLKMIMITPTELILPSEHELETRSKYFDLFSQHVHLMGKNSSILFPSFYEAFLNMLEYDSGNKKYEDAPSEFDAAFIEMEDSLLKEASKLSKQLKYPDLSASISTIRNQRLNE